MEVDRNRKCDSIICYALSKLQINAQEQKKKDRQKSKYLSVSW